MEGYELNDDKDKCTKKEGEEKEGEKKEGEEKEGEEKEGEEKEEASSSSILSMFVGFALIS